jgi:hypothetical protein
MANTLTDQQLFCASALTYSIVDATTTNADLAAVQPWYTPIGFASTSDFQICTATNLPETAACIIGVVNGCVLLAFRGTAFTDISDWATDLLVEPLTVTGYAGSQGATIHPGLYYSMMEVMPQITAWLSANGGNMPVYITGHSKGGGMAVLATWYLGQINTPALSDITITTFAAPMVGNEAFVDEFIGPYSQTNYINYLDLVPFLPFTTDEANTIITDYVNNIQDAALKAFLTTVLNQFASFGYSATTTNVMYIEQGGGAAVPVNILKFIVDPNYYKADLTAIGADFQSGNYDAIMAAHSCACGGGYASSICPGIVCPS